jgi:heme/copper-type cytochrome/quinol oxidase subunit 2
LKLTIFYAETDIQPKAGLSDTTIMYIGVVVLAALVFVVVFLVFRKRGKKPEEEPEKEMDNK